MKKGFVKTLEVIIAALLLIGFQTYLPEVVKNPAYTQSRDITFLAQDAGNNIEKSNIEDAIVRNSSIVASKISGMLSGKYGFNLRLEKAIKINVTRVSGSNNNVSFSYNFPALFDKNSIALYSNEYGSYPANIGWNWYQIPFVYRTYNETFANRNIMIDINFTNSTILPGLLKNDSLIFYFNGEIAPIQLLNWTANSNGANATVILNIPEMLPNQIVNGYILYANSSTYYSRMYPNLSFPNLIRMDCFNFTAFQANASGCFIGFPAQAPRGDVGIYLPDLQTNNEKDIYMIYKLGSREQLQYSPALTVNNSGISITLPEDDYKSGWQVMQPPVPDRSYSYKTTFLNPNEIYSIVINVWYLA